MKLGEDAEQALIDLFNGVQDQSIKLEVKCDEVAAETGNLYLEYQQKPRGAVDFRPSGIQTTRADWLAYRVGPFTIHGPTEEWLRLARVAYQKPSNRRDCRRGDNPTRGVLLPFFRDTLRLVGQSQHSNTVHKAT